MIMVSMAIGVKSQTWIQKGTDIYGDTMGDALGSSVNLSADGNTLAVSAPNHDANGTEAGRVVVYMWNGSDWIPKGNAIDGEAAGDLAGWSVCLNPAGDAVAVGAIWNNDGGPHAGQVRVFTWNGSTWIQKGSDIDGEAPDDYFSNPLSLSADANTVAAGSAFNSSAGLLAGHVRIFEWNGNDWAQKGLAIEGDSAFECSGVTDLSADGNTVAVGAPGCDTPPLDSGYVRVFSWDGNAWVQKGPRITGDGAGSHFGSVVRLTPDGETLAIGIIGSDSTGTDAGQVKVYSWNGTYWEQKGLALNGEAAGDQFGRSVAISADGSRIAVGAHRSDAAGMEAGTVKVYAWNGSGWATLGMPIDGEAAYDHQGASISLNADGTILATGANKNSAGGILAGQARVFSFCMPIADTIIVTACDSFTWSNGITYIQSTNTATDTFMDPAGCDSVVWLDLTINHSTKGNDFVTTCGPYTWIDGQVYSAPTDSATYAFTTTWGCDSTVTLHLAFQPLDNTLSLNGNALSANEPGATYQWLDCGNGFAPLPGETGQTFTAAQTGSYAVQISKNNCTDTSECIETITQGIPSNMHKGGIRVYPNPTTGQLYLEFTTRVPEVEIQVKNPLGQIVQTKTFSGSAAIPIQLSGPPGIYLLVVKGQSGQRTLRVTKE